MRLANRCTPLAVAAALVAIGTVAVPVARATVRDQSASATATRKAVVKKVKVADDFYSPTKLTIKVGDKVNFVWSPTNTSTHNVTLVSGPKGVNKKKFTSLDGSTNFHFERTFTVPGKYHFQCTIHPTMMNTFVTVEK
jgi:plastocyanin